MRNWIDRLTRCGIPEGAAEEIVRHLIIKGKIAELIAYVRITEEAMGK